MRRREVITLLAGAAAMWPRGGARAAGENADHRLSGRGIGFGFGLEGLDPPCIPIGQQSKREV